MIFILCLAVFCLFGSLLIVWLVQIQLCKIYTAKYGIEVLCLYLCMLTYCFCSVQHFVFANGLYQSALFLHRTTQKSVFRCAGVSRLNPVCEANFSAGLCPAGSPKNDQNKVCTMVGLQIFPGTFIPHVCPHDSLYHMFPVNPVKIGGQTTFPSDRYNLHGMSKFFRAAVACS